MEENRNLEQAGAVSVVSTGKKYESRKRETSGKDVQAIRSFLESLSVYEADALRVSIAIADGKATATNRAFQLLERVAEFCDKRQLVSVNRSLLSIAVDVADISRAVSSLDKRPASGQPFPNNTGTSGAGK